MVNIQKAAIIGCGFVGASSAFSLLQKGIFSELVLIDANKEKAEGEAMDISHGRPYAHPMKIYAGDYDDVADAAIVIISAGAGQKPGETKHSMPEEHFIEWITLNPNQGIYRKQLNPGQEPATDFCLCDGEQVEEVYAYCNLHGLWKC